MKKRVIAGLLAFAWLSALEAQRIHDPNDALYHDIDQWVARGYITDMVPLIRPYPAQLIDALLAQVLDRGNAEAREKATGYQKNIAPGSRLIHAGVNGSIEGENDDVAAEGAIFADGVIRIRGWISAGYSMFIQGGTRTPGKELNVPGTYSPYPDLVSDTANIGPLNLFQNWTSMLSVGQHNFYVQAGLGRTAWGPFYDTSVIVGPQAGRAGHFSLNYRRPRWSFEMLFLALTASDDYGDGFFPEKYTVAHSINFNILPNLEVGFLESVIWGGRLEFLYLIPFVQLFGAQALSDFGDNSFMGFHIRWNTGYHIQVLTQVYIDDLHLNDVMRLKFNTKYKLAGELGLVWAPPEGPLASLAGDYTLVFPYMYTHWHVPDTGDPTYLRDVPNYFTYSHMGRNLGASLEPNSDRISLRSRWRTLRNFDVAVSAYLTRHGNPSAGVDMSEGRHDGSIFDDGVTSDDGNNYSTLHFLTQPLLDIRLAGGFGVIWSLPTTFGVFSLNADYILEYGWNRGLAENHDGLTHYWSIGGSWRF
ncbi:MAG: hypothetical protein LBT14_10735 [Treponema sp.]|nr:hypothetical protein [Treponema sp.]